MLRLVTDAASRDCSGVTRRDFLEAGTLGLGGLSLSSLLSARARAATAGVDFVRDRAVVLLFLSGGASHIETFDPNMDAPAPYHSTTGEVRTPIPGVSFGGTFPRLARLARRMAVVRSFQHPVGSHEPAILHVLSGGTDTRGRGNEGFSIGSLATRLRGANHPLTGIPSYALLDSDEVDGQYRKEKARVRRGSRPGPFGAIHGPFRPDGSGPAIEDMRLTIEHGRLADRRGLLSALDRMRRAVEKGDQLAAADRYRRQAFDLLLGSASAAFDLSGEPRAILERYDTSSISIGYKKFRPSNLGTLMLMARRLCEAGCGFVTVHSAGWDMHADGNNPGIVKGMEMLGTTVDIAVSAFLEDLEARGLADRVLLVITGDFGRTPKINKRGGRDHWARLGTLAFAGGGLRMGQVIGRSNRRVEEPATEPVTPHHLMATVLHTLFDIGELRIARGIPSDMMRLVEEAEPIGELF